MTTQRKHKSIPQFVKVVKICIQILQDVGHEAADKTQYTLEYERK